MARKSIGTWPAACAASTWTSTPAHGRPPRPRRRAGWCRPRGCPTGRGRAPVSGRTASSSAAGSIRPWRSQPTRVRSWRAEPRRTAECSTALRHDVRTAGGGAEDRVGDGLGGAAREDDLAAARAEQRGDLLAGLLDGHPRGLPLVVDPRRVAGVAEQPRHHGLPRLRSGRRGGRVVEVVAGHAVPTVPAGRRRCGRRPPARWSGRSRPRPARPWPARPPVRRPGSPCPAPRRPRTAGHAGSGLA